MPDDLNDCIDFKLHLCKLTTHLLDTAIHLSKSTRPQHEGNPLSCQSRRLCVCDRIQISIVYPVEMCLLSQQIPGYLPSLESYQFLANSQKRDAWSAWKTQRYIPSMLYYAPEREIQRLEALEHQNVRTLKLCRKK